VHLHYKFQPISFSLTHDQYLAHLWAPFAFP
jgi:hypothetical protein